MMDIEVWNLSNDIKRALATRTDNYFDQMRDTECVEKAAKENNEALLKIYLKHVNSPFRFRVIREAYNEIVADSDVAPEDLINEHGIQMREIIQKELDGEFFGNLNSPISVLAMGLTESEVNLVVSLTRRGIFDVEAIKDFLSQAKDGSSSLQEGTL